ncbi:MAG: ATP-binding protein [Puia sp.]
MVLDYSYVSFKQVMDDMRMLFEPLAREKGLQLEFATEADMITEIETDKMKLEQILKNLLSNAFKFTDSGVISLRIKPDPQNRGRSVLFEVRDSGIGIPADKLGLIFEAFQQADGSTKRKYGGTGMGLSISRELSYLLKGDLSVSSKEGEGSVFILRVPVSQHTQQELSPIVPFLLSQPLYRFCQKKTNDRPVNLPLTEIPKGIPDDREDILQGDKVILIVEDDTHFATALLNYTRSQQYKAIVAVRGDEAIHAGKNL